jgi:hypothetical protein
MPRCSRSGRRLATQGPRRRLGLEPRLGVHGGICVSAFALRSASRAPFFPQLSAAGYAEGKQNRRIMASCGDQHKTVPDRIVKAQAPPDVKERAD